MRRILAVIEYDGTDFHGWQFQGNARTIQGVFEDALKNLFGEKRRVTAAGRTDAGVHAEGQAVHFDLENPIPPESLVPALNSALPPDVAVRRARRVRDDFNAMRDAVSRSYHYSISHGGPPPVIDRRRLTWIPHRLDPERMARAAGEFVGRHDFSSFRSSSCTARSPVRTMLFCGVSAPKDGLLELVCRGRSFLHNQVRIMAGTLMEIGAGRLPVSAIREIIEARDRGKAGPTAPARGLVLKEVEYPPYPEEEGD